MVSSSSLVTPRQVSRPVYLCFQLVLLAIYLCVASQFQSLHSAEPPKSWIGYTEGRNDLPNGQFYNWQTNRACIVRSDGSERTELAVELIDRAHSWTQFAGWSPDGKQAIVGSFWESPENAAWERDHKTFRMTEGWLADMCLVDLSSKKLINLTKVDRVSIYNTGLFFLPNARGFGFTPLINGISKPFVMDFDGTHKRDVSSNGTGFTYGYSVSSNGQRIAYHEDYQIYVANVDGTDKRKIDTGNSFNFAPAWSPDSEWLMFVSGQHYDCHPHVVRADGTQLVKLADRGGYRGVVEKLKHPDFHSESSDIPVWAHDGKSIFYTAKVGQAVELMRANLDGTISQLTRSSPNVRHYHPAISPDGQWLLFGSDRSGRMQLHRCRVDGSELSQITNVGEGYMAMHGFWQPIKSVEN